MAKQSNGITWHLRGLLQLSEEMERTQPKMPQESKICTCEGMMKRVLEERMENAAKANYRIDFADNIYGEHTLMSGKVAVKNRGKLVRKFESDPNCKVFLSSEAGGAGLNPSNGRYGDQFRTALEPGKEKPMDWKDRSAGPNQ